MSSLPGNVRCFQRAWITLRSFCHPLGSAWHHLWSFDLFAEGRRPVIKPAFFCPLAGEMVYDLYIAPIYRRVIVSA